MCKQVTVHGKMAQQRFTGSQVFGSCEGSADMCANNDDACQDGTAGAGSRSRGLTCIPLKPTAPIDNDSEDDGLCRDVQNLHTSLQAHSIVFKTETQRHTPSILEFLTLVVPERESHGQTDTDTHRQAQPLPYQPWIPCVDVVRAVCACVCVCLYVCLSKALAHRAEAALVR